MLNEKKTGYPSTDKPWLKYYNEETINIEMEINDEASIGA